jgi:hypothetical protein
MHLEVQTTSPAGQASIHLIIAACCEFWAASAELVVVWAFAKKAKPAATNRVVKRILAVC